MKQQRKIDEVAYLMYMAMKIVEPIGYAFEPIATMSDPEEEIKGDYVLRLSFLSGRNEENTYCSIFQAYVAMCDLLCSDDGAFNDLIFRLLKEAVIYRFSAEAAIESGESVTIGSHGPDANLGDVLKTAHDMLTKVRH